MVLRDKEALLASLRVALERAEMTNCGGLMVEMFEVDRVDRIADILYGVATGGGLIGYAQIAKRVATRPDFLSAPLDQVSSRAADRDEPLWSALVVAKGTGRPNSGFYRMARRVRPEYQELDDETLWVRERNRCYAAAGGRTSVIAADYRR